MHTEIFPVVDNQLVEFLRGRKPKTFRPRPFYSKEADSLVYFFKDEDHFAERFDEYLTVYLGMESEDFVGFKLKGVGHLLETIGDLFVQVRDDHGKLMLSMLLVAQIE